MKLRFGFRHLRAALLSLLFVLVVVLFLYKVNIIKGSGKLLYAGAGKTCPNLFDLLHESETRFRLRNFNSNPIYVAGLLKSENETTCDVRCNSHLIPKSKISYDAITGPKRHLSKVLSVLYNSQEPEFDSIGHDITMTTSLESDVPLLQADNNIFQDKGLVDLFLTQPSCRLCIHIATNIRKRQLNIFRPRFTCWDPLHHATWFDVSFRERGKYHFMNVYLKVTADSISPLDTLKMLMRQEMQKNGYRLFRDDSNMLNTSFYRIYRVEANQQNVLFGDDHIDSDIKLINFLESSSLPPLLEIILL